jgi:glycine cleavage system H protein
MGDGWFIKVKLSNASELDDLMDDDAYQTFIED